MHKFQQKILCYSMEKVFLVGVVGCDMIMQVYLYIVVSQKKNEVNACESGIIFLTLTNPLITMYALHRRKVEDDHPP